MCTLLSVIGCPLILDTRFGHSLLLDNNIIHNYNCYSCSLQLTHDTLYFLGGIEIGGICIYIVRRLYACMYKSTNHASSYYLAKSSSSSIELDSTSTQRCCPRISQLLRLEEIESIAQIDVASLSAV